VETGCLSFSTKLRAVLDALPPGGVAVADIRDLFGQEGLMLLTVFLTIPFSNTLPALALLFLAIGSLQRDGLCILIGHLANFITMAYFAVLIGGGGVLVHGIFQHLSGN
jgi:hypothetical protein